MCDHELNTDCAECGCDTSCSGNAICLGCDEHGWRWCTMCKTAYQVQGHDDDGICRTCLKLNEYESLMELADCPF